jgi:hypothetical protein
MLVQSRTGPPSGRPGFTFSPFITRVSQFFLDFLVFGVVLIVQNEGNSTHPLSQTLSVRLLWSTAFLKLSCAGPEAIVHQG